MLRIFLKALFIIVISANTSFAQETPVEPAMKPEEVLKITEHDVIWGQENAPVTIVEYASMSCPHCADFHKETFPKIKAEYIDKGKVKYVFRDFPLDEPALRGSMIARCSGKDKFSKFIDAIFSTLENWAPKKNYLEILSNIAKLGGMSGEEFEKCIADKDLELRIMEGKFNAAKSLEIRSTPSFFINGELTRGAMKFEQFAEHIDKLIAEKQAVPAVPKKPE